MTVQLSPPLVDLCTCCEPAYRTFELCGLTMIGNVHWNRYFRSFAGWPIGLSGHGLTFRSRPLRRSFRVSSAPYEPAYTTSGSSLRAAIQPDSPPPASFQSLIAIVPSGERLGPHSVELSCCAPHT